MPITENILKKYANPYFIETGTYYGETVQRAVNIGFNKIISVEVSKRLYDMCFNKFKDDKRVALYYGDVELLLGNILKGINDRITFWLDAHYSGGETSYGLRKDPIIEELEIIKRHGVKDHTILVDDIRLMNKDLLIKKIKEINNNYVLTYEDGFIPNDILVAKI